MAHIDINLSKIAYNAEMLRSLLEEQDIQLTPVIKCVAGDTQIIETLIQLGFNHFADSRLENITTTTSEKINYLLLRPTAKNQYEELIKTVKISMQTEIETIRQLNEMAARLNDKHQVMLMIDWKDGREGILTYNVLEYIREIIAMKHIQLVGIAFNFMCFKSMAPTEDDIYAMNQFVGAIENELGFRLKIISGGNSSMLPQLMYNDLGCINELRIGETLFRGIDTTTFQPMPRLYQDAITLEAEIIEIKPRVISTNQCYLQAILDIGYIDTYIEKIIPINDKVKIIGATSDHLMVDLDNQDFYQVGDTMQFSLEYEALSQVMYQQRLTKRYKKDKMIESLIKHIDASTLVPHKA
ncbi:alanine racemase [Staphylococcus devriesei]|uniref:Alanine racemase n=1 Tax=Staphylococcus devriesei TaxID=586733 RepID=A0A2K4DKF5_9STAP|nr:alanine racemase [Staphylococcus devriesei]MCE5089976.1 alanine racemase [Staphylococcus devriesei]MCE5097936.1 alanine racemase [Staphylococcus devriesei]PNZ87286.1 alanine racemase [Staphylococcus devriesei]PTF14103.1 alanine racemase [Staphylococcus devriesei]PTF16450.1 alanine racemase [Staphylococcus devriesei]